MFELMKSLPKNILGVRASGTLTSEDYSTVLEPAFEELHKKGQKVACLAVFDETYDGFTPGAMWSDFQLGVHYMNQITKGAVVTNSEWVKKLTNFASPIIPMPLKVFTSNEYDAAIDWLSLTEKPHVHYKFNRKKGLLEVKVDEKLNQADFTKLASVIDPWLEEHGALNGLMISASSFPGWKNFGSMMKHIKFVGEHHKKIDRVAIVADGVAANSLPALANHFVNSDIKHFEASDREKAMEFLAQ
jgi:hypothetical protein